MPESTLRELLHDQPLVVVRRLALLSRGRRVFVIRGELVDVTEDLHVELVEGPRTGDWTVRLPPCPDCGGELVPWLFDGCPDGTHRCCGAAVRIDEHGATFHPADGCGSVFSVAESPL